jgi:predicted 3-demethylubiquinone-9 3-methyltransferase (glyoxalase superfamily)
VTAEHSTKPIYWQTAMSQTTLPIVIFHHHTSLSLAVILLVNNPFIKSTSMAFTKQLTTNLWFDSQAEEAAKFYCSVFKDSKMGAISRYSKEGFEFHGRPEGSVMTVTFEIMGQPFVALNGGPIFKFNESVSFIINCENQEEIDYYWGKLTAGGDPKAQQCGWLKDKFSLSWQVVPAMMGKIMSSGDQKTQSKLMHAFMPMKKIDLATLEEAVGNTSGV